MQWLGDLVALQLPGNIEAHLSEAQARLFGETGDVVLRALPPLVPLYWADAAAAGGGDDGSGRPHYGNLLPYRSSIRLGRRLAAGELQVTDSYAFFPLTPNETLEALRRDVAGLVPALTARQEPPLPAGILLGWRSGRGNASGDQGPVRPSLSAQPSGPSGTIRRVEGVVLRIRADAAAPREWTAVTWEELATFRVRRAPDRDTSA